jgi:uncharacterized surface anchored protein
MVTVAFRDSAGRPLAGAVVSVAAAPGEFPDIGMVADDQGEINLTTTGIGDYEFVVFAEGATQHVDTHISGAESHVALVVPPPPG